VLTVIKILSLAGLIFWFMAAKGSLGCELDECLDVTNTKCRNGSWLPISGTALISGISALVGSMFLVSLGKGNFIAGEIKNPKRNVGLSLF
jgi:APA family basic amino acid/polyamine antiporter